MKYSHNSEQLAIFDFNGVLQISLDVDNELVAITKIIPWDELVDIVSTKYSSKRGRRAKSIRMMLGLEILKRKYALCDESVIERFKTDYLFQYFCGFNSFVNNVPHSTSMTKFRNRLGDEILQKIESAVAKKLIPTLPVKRRHSITDDSTCIPANITFPTDTKLLHTVYDKLVDYIKKNKENLKIKVIRGYRKVKKFIRNFNLKRNKTKKEIISARKKLVRAAKNLLLKISKKVTDTTCQAAKRVLEIAQKIIEQQDKRNKSKTNIIEDRIVSFHEPEVRPIKRGKDNAKCEFGKKVGLSVIGEGILVTTKIDNNNFDDHELVKAGIERHKEITGRDPTEQIMDRGGDSKKNHDLLKEKKIKDGIQRKGRQSEKPTRSQKRQRRRRSVIEGKIGTAKQFYGLNRNRYKHQNATKWITFGLIAMNTTWAVRKLRKAA